MLDVVAVAMLAVIPLMAWSIYLVKFRKQYKLHRMVQTGLGVTLLVAVTLFEIEMRINGWRHMAEPSKYYDTWVNPVLAIHLGFAIPTTFLWIYTILSALKHLRGPNIQEIHRRRHRRVARFSAIGMFMTAVTGWGFYWLAFVA